MCCSEFWSFSSWCSFQKVSALTVSLMIPQSSSVLGLQSDPPYWSSATWPSSWLWRETGFRLASVCVHLVLGCMSAPAPWTGMNIGRAQAEKRWGPWALERKEFLWSGQWAIKLWLKSEATCKRSRTETQLLLFEIRKIMNVKHLCSLMAQRLYY